MENAQNGWLAVSVRQPFAHLILSGVKKYECRTWCPSVLGAFIIHASAAPVSTVDKHDPNIVKALELAGVEDVDALPRGRIVGIVNFNKIIMPDDESEIRKIPKFQRMLCTSDGNVDDFFLWKATSPAFLPPVPCKGSLNTWQVSSAVLKRLNGHVTA